MSIKVTRSRCCHTGAEKCCSFSSITMEDESESVGMPLPLNCCKGMGLEPSTDEDSSAVATSNSVGEIPTQFPTPTQVDADDGQVGTVSSNTTGSK
eukprot:scaffold609_cov170-Amphora_coffeaeformis.AAC.12